MALIVWSKGFDGYWPPETLEGGTISARSTTSMTYTSHANYVVTLTGTDFTYDLDNLPNTGTVTGITIARGGVTYATISSVSVDFGYAGLRLFGFDRDDHGFEHPWAGGLFDFMLRGDDEITGSAEDDDIEAGAGHDTVNAGAGRDYVTGDAGDDVIDGGADRDMLSYRDSFQSGNATQGVNIDVVEGIVQDSWGGTDTISGFEEFRDSIFSDTIIGSEEDERFEMSRGADSLDAGAGWDQLSYEHVAQLGAKRGVNVNLTTGLAIDSWGGRDTIAGIEEVKGSKFNDTMMGSANDDVFVSNAGLDSYNGGAGNDMLAFWDNGYGNTGKGVSIDMTKSKAMLNDGFGKAETLTGFERIDGSRFGDTMIGGSGNEEFNGNSGADSLNGGSGHDNLRGDSGKDTLIGGSGNDFIFSGNDLDQLTGGAGRDEFLFRGTLSKAGADVITDFSVVDDTIQVSADWGGGFESSELTAAQFRSGANITTASTAAHRFIYNRTTGDLYFDDDGVGGDAAVKFATLSNKAVLTIGDFWIGDIIG